MSTLTEPTVAPADHRPAWRRLAPAAIATLIAFAILLGLGFWQIERMGSKQRLLARVEAGLAGTPKPLPPEQAWPALKPKAYDYEKVRFHRRRSCTTANCTCTAC